MKASTGNFKSEGKIGTPNTMTPATIKMIENATKDNTQTEFTLDNNKIDYICIVGRLISVKESNVRIYFEINDCTGNIMVWIYRKDANDIPRYLKNMDLSKENMYVKCILNIRVVNNKTIYFCSHLTEVTDYNEVTNHLLSTFLTSLQRINGYKETKMEPKVNKKKITNVYQKNEIDEILNDSDKDLKQKILELYQIYEEKKIDLSVEQIVEIFKGDVRHEQVLDKIQDLIDIGCLIQFGEGYKVLSS